MSIDLLERLICDIISITQELMDSAATEGKVLEPDRSSLEKEYTSKAGHRKSHGKHPMSGGVHKTVC
jgi:glutamate decarboxylase